MLDHRTSDSIDLGTTLDALSRSEIERATAMLAGAVSDMRADPAFPPDLPAAYERLLTVLAAHLIARPDG